MKTPSDYVENSSAEHNTKLDSVSDGESPMTIRKVVDRFHSNQPITDEMINDACRQMDSVYHFKNKDKNEQPVNPLRKLFKSVF